MSLWRDASIGKRGPVPVADAVKSLAVALMIFGGQEIGLLPLHALIDAFARVDGDTMRKFDEIANDMGAHAV